MFAIHAIDDSDSIITIAKSIESENNLWFYVFNIHFIYVCHDNVRYIVHTSFHIRIRIYVNNMYINDVCVFSEKVMLMNVHYSCALSISYIVPVFVIFKIVYLLRGMKEWALSIH